MPARTLPVDGPIRLFVTDLDNTLNPYEDDPLDLALLAEVQVRNRASVDDPTVPPLTLLTGRPQPYLYAMLQAIDGRLPGVFEHGVGQFSLGAAESVRMHPAWTRERAAQRRKLLQLVEGAMVEPGWGTVQIGKLAAVTVIPTPPQTAFTLEEPSRILLERVDDAYTLHVGPKVVDFVPDGVDKGAGVRWLAETLGIPAAQVAAMGDSTTDAQMFPEVGLGIAPANAPDDVKARAVLVTAAPTTAGVLEAYDALITHNRNV